MEAYSPNIIANSMLSCRIHNPDGEYVVYGNRRITWKEMVPRVFKIAQALIKLGVKKNDKVAFMFHNTPEFIEVNNAIQVAGAVPTPMNYRYVQSEVEFQASHSDAKVFVYDAIWAEALEPAIKNVSNIEHCVCYGKSDLHDAIPYESFVNSGEDRDPQVKNNWDDVAVMIYTGGTTGFPKGVMLTYKAHVDMFSMLLASVIQRTLTMDVSKEKHKLIIEPLPMPAKTLISPFLRTRVAKKFFSREKTFEFLKNLLHKRLSDPDTARRGYKDVTKGMCPSMPFFHDAAYANLFLGELIGSITYFLPDTVSFDPPKILEMIEQEGVTNLSNVPTGWKKLVSYEGFDKYDVSSVRVATTGGGSCSAHLKKQILEKFPTAIILDAFGQTEMTPVTSFRLDASADALSDRSVGKSIVETKIVDNDGNEVKAGEIGEILYRSETVMKGYYKDDEKTEEAFQDGWFRSGDLGYLDKNGEIRTVERKKECINTGGEKVFPLEVEEILQTHESVDYACVIGVPDEDWGSTIRAVIQPKSGQQIEAKEIKAFCRGKLAAYKIPRSVVVTEKLPFSPAGKLLRQKVREEFI